MDRDTEQIIIRTLANRVDFLEWKVKDTGDECAKLRAQVSELKATIADYEHDVFVCPKCGCNWKSGDGDAEQ